VGDRPPKIGIQRQPRFDNSSRKKEGRSHATKPTWVLDVEKGKGCVSRQSGKKTKEGVQGRQLYGEKRRASCATTKRRLEVLSIRKGEKKKTIAILVKGKGGAKGTRSYSEQRRSERGK